MNQMVLGQGEQSVFDHHARSEQAGLIDHGAVGASEEGKVGPRKAQSRKLTMDGTWIGVGQDKANPAKDKARFA
jgi:hypothetical protein